MHQKRKSIAVQLNLSRSSELDGDKL